MGSLIYRKYDGYPPLMEFKSIEYIRHSSSEWSEIVRKDSIRTGWGDFGEETIPEEDSKYTIDDEKIKMLEKLYRKDKIKKILTLISLL